MIIDNIPTFSLLAHLRDCVQIISALAVKVRVKERAKIMIGVWQLPI